MANIAMTTLSSKLISNEKELFAKMCLRAVKRLEGSDNLLLINIIKKPGGQLRESYLCDGFILEKKIFKGCETRIENPKIMVTNTSLELDKLKLHGVTVRTKSLQNVKEIEAAERAKISKKM